MTNKDPLSTALGLTPRQDEDITDVFVIDGSSSTETNEQEFAKSQIKTAINQGGKALTDLLAIAKASQHPRAYEVVATLVNTIASASEKLAKVELQQQEAVSRAKGPAGPSTVNNNLFVGTTADLLHILKKAQKE